MESIFSRDTTKRPTSVYDLINPEITHLKKRNSVRDANPGSKTASWVFGIAISALLGLYFMDPFLFALHKNDAVHAYLYLRNNDGQKATKALVDSQILSPGEIASLNERQGTYQEYFASDEEAQQKADEIVRYMSGVHQLHDGPYESLDPVGKLRFLLFTRTGILPPTEWSGLNPSVD